MTTASQPRAFTFLLRNPPRLLLPTSSSPSMMNVRSQGSSVSLFRTASTPFRNTAAELPCDLTFIIEGEEEVGSKSLGGFLKRNVKALGCDAVVISDNGLP